MNFQRFNARTLDLAALEGACMAMPFMAERRLILVENSELLKDTGQTMKRLLQLLPAVPPTTALVFLAEVTLERRDADAAFRSASSLHRWIEEHPDTAYSKALPLPRGQAFDRWLQDRAHHHQAELSSAGASLLAEFTAGDPRTADLELAKLADYVGGERAIAPEDIETLSPYQGQSDVFAMVDAMGNRDIHAALRMLDQILAHEDARAVFPMIVRQFRLILLAHEAEAAGIPLQVALRAPPFVARKAAAQARRFARSDLDRIYHLLVEIDVNSKTGREDLTPALHSLVAGLGG
jgi:DNA polymerase-3 subunit delta